MNDYEGQLCPYNNCAHHLEIVHEGFFICEACQRLFWCRESDSDYEDYKCYNLSEYMQKTTIAPLPIEYPIAKDLGASWASPKEKADSLYVIDVDGNVELVNDIGEIK